MSYRRLFSESESNRLPTKGCQQHADHRCRDSGTRRPDAARRPLARLEGRGAVPCSNDSWESNPWRQVRATSSRETRRDSVSCLRLKPGVSSDPKRRKPPGCARRLSRKSLKTAYICLKSAGTQSCSDARRSHAVQSSRYTTAFMTGSVYGSKRARQEFSWNES